MADALELAPSDFIIHARNPEKDVRVGGPDFILLPGYGAPFMVDENGNRREARMDDYDDFCRLIQTSTYLDANGFMMVEPSDVPPATAYLDMMLSNMLLCDKAFMGSPVSGQGAKEGMEMTAILMGGESAVKNRPVTISLINSLSPLQFSEEMASSLMELAKWGQPCIIAALAMAGSSGPVTLAGLVAMQNAEILAGMTLAQLVNPGTPVVYGSTSAPMDMRSGALTIGAPELSTLISAAAQMAQYYNLPCRSGGGLTDAHVSDYQAGSESMLSLSTAVRCGVNVVLHACGILGAYIAMSFDKFLLDEEACGMVRRLIRPVGVTDETISLDIIQEVGIGGQYLTHDKTFELCRTEFFLPTLANRQGADMWAAEGKKTAARRAAESLSQRLESWEKPEIDPAVEKDLKTYVEKRKG